jgi:hypothetical protein
MPKHLSHGRPRAPCGLRRRGVDAIPAGYRPGVQAGMAADREARRRAHRLAGQFAARYAAVGGLDVPEFVRPDWAHRNRLLAADWRHGPPWDFLRHPAIAFQMFVSDRHLAAELPYVRERLEDAAALCEPAVGGPPRVRLADPPVATSSNTVHHLHHLLRYEDATGRRVADAGTIVEWGAGYGNLARILAGRHGGAPTCVLVDTPLFSCLQWLYLASVLGEERVVLHERAPARPAPRRINVVPLGLAATLEVAADLFVSTWALNESTRAAQDLVVGRGWFGARSLLLAMHLGDPLAPVAVAHGADPVPLGPFAPGQHYFVR